MDKAQDINLRVIKVFIIKWNSNENLEKKNKLQIKVLVVLYFKKEGE